MSKHKPNCNTYVCLVDNHRSPSRKRNTAGRYYVGAKNKKEAAELFQKAIGFGSVQVHYIAIPDSIDPILEYKEVKRAVMVESRFETAEAIHANARRKDCDIV